MDIYDNIIILIIVTFMIVNVLFAYHGLNGDLGDGVRRFLMCMTDDPRIDP